MVLNRSSTEPAVFLCSSFLIRGHPSKTSGPKRGGSTKSGRPWKGGGSATYRMSRNDFFRCFGVRIGVQHPPVNGPPDCNIFRVSDVLTPETV